MKFSNGRAQHRAAAGMILHTQSSSLSAAGAPRELTVEPASWVPSPFFVCVWALKRCCTVYCFASWLAMAQLSFGIG